MERIGKILPRVDLSNAPSIPDQRIYKLETLLTFDEFKPVKGSESALQAFKRLASGSGKPMCMVYGGVGNGKSHLMEALVHELKLLGYYLRLMDCPKLIRTLEHSRECDSRRNNGGKPWRSFDELMTSFSSSQFFIMDDLGMGIPEKGYKADDAWAWIEEIINSRYDKVIHGENIMTVISTNMDLPNLPPRILSRFQDKAVSELILNEAPDYRKRKG